MEKLTAKDNGMKITGKLLLVKIGWWKNCQQMVISQIGNMEKFADK